MFEDRGTRGLGARTDSLTCHPLTAYKTAVCLSLFECIVPDHSHALLSRPELDSSSFARHFCF